MLCRDKCGYCTFAQPPARLESPVPHARRGAAHRPRRARRRLPRGAVHPRRAARGALPGRPASGSTSTATPRPSTTWWPWPARPRRDRAAPPRQRRRPLPRRAGRAAAGLALAGDDARVAQPRPRRPPRLARQDARAPAGHARGGRRAGHPVHHRHPRRHRRVPGRPHRGARGHRRQPPPARPRAGGDRPELPAEAGHRDARGAALPARRPPRGHRAGPADPPARRPRAGAAQPVRRLRSSCSTPASTTGAASRPSPPTTSTPSGPGPRSTGCARSPRRAGFELAPRLTVYPEFVLDPERWLDPDVRFPVLDRSDAEGLGRDDPGAVFPQKVGRDPATSATAPRSCSSGRRSTAWYSGADGRPAVLLPAAPSGAGRRRGGRGARRACASASEVGDDEIVTLFSARGREVAAVAEVADDLRARTIGDVVTFVRNRNINYTNVCTFKCRFCGFSKGPLSLNLRGTPVPPHARRHRRPGASRPGTGAPPRSASRAASTRTSTATTTSTSPGP